MVLHSDSSSSLSSLSFTCTCTAGCFTEGRHAMSCNSSFHLSESSKFKPVHRPLWIYFFNSVSAISMYKLLKPNISIIIMKLIINQDKQIGLWHSILPQETLYKWLNLFVVFSIILCPRSLDSTYLQLCINLEMRVPLLHSCNNHRYIAFSTSSYNSLLSVLHLLAPLDVYIL